MPTPLTKTNEPDLEPVLSTGKTISQYLKKGQLVVLESSTYPGTTNEELSPILESSGLKNGAAFYLAYSPEREDPGSEDYTTTTIPKIVGADDKNAINLGGSSIKDFKKSDGKFGKYQQKFKVYGKDNLKCPTRDCKSFIRKVRLSGRSTYFCPSCQK